MPLLVRTWQSPDGYDGNGWEPERVARFEALMRKATTKRKGEPVLVTAWDRGKWCRCWYEARACPEETALRDKVRAIFGTRERDPDL